MSWADEPGDLGQARRARLSWAITCVNILTISLSQNGYEHGNEHGNAGNGDGECGSDDGDGDEYDDDDGDYIGLRLECSTRLSRLLSYVGMVGGWVGHGPLPDGAISAFIGVAAFAAVVVVSVAPRVDAAAWSLLVPALRAEHAADLNGSMGRVLGNNGGLGG